MGRPIYPHELEDPDFAWLISTYRENHPHCSPVESTCLPIVFIKDETDVDESEVPQIHGRTLGKDARGVCENK